MITSEDTRGVAFGGSDRSRVIKQLAQLVDCVAHVGAQHVFAEELVKHLAHRALQKCHAAGMSGTMP